MLEAAFMRIEDPKLLRLATPELTETREIIHPWAGIKSALAISIVPGTISARLRVIKRRSRS